MSSKSTAIWLALAAILVAFIFFFERHFKKPDMGPPAVFPGLRAEEFICAQALDAHPKVKHWVRNIERQEKFSFWLPTATDYFYPDFVAELTDGRLLVVEYKGDAYATNDDSREKKQVGHQWEQSGEGRCLFLFAVADDNGRTVAKQIADKIERA